MCQKVKMFSLATLLTVSAFAAAEPRSDDKYILTYSAAELTSSLGMQSVYRRIERAARDYCPSYNQIRSHPDVRTCVKGVVQDLVAKTNHQDFQLFVAGELKIADEQIVLQPAPDARDKP